MDITPYLPMIISLLVTGVIAGLMAGLLGIGGGLVLVPVLFYVFSGQTQDPVTALTTATATSLAIIVPTSISSVSAHFRQKNIDIALLKTWWIWILLGVLCASSLINWLRGVWIQVLFSGFAIFMGVKIALQGSKKNTPSTFWRYIPNASAPWSIGFISTLVGIGGGTLTVPALTSKGYIMSRAIGTSSAVGFIIALPAALSLMLASPPADPIPFTLGLVNIAAFAITAPLATLVAPIGARWSKRVDPKQLKRLFALVLVVTGVRIALSIF